MVSSCTPSDNLLSYVYCLLGCGGEYTWKPDHPPSDAGITIVGDHKKNIIPYRRISAITSAYRWKMPPQRQLNSETGPQGFRCLIHRICTYSICSTTILHTFFEKERPTRSGGLQRRRRRIGSNYCIFAAVATLLQGRLKAVVTEKE